MIFPNPLRRTGRIILPVAMACFTCASAYAQNVAINADGSLPDKHAMLDIKSANKGVLMPRVTTEARMKIPNTQGMLVYDINTNSFWFNTGRQWVNMSSADASRVADSAWLLTGNAGTVDGVNFLGTIDNVPLNIRVNNQRSGRIDATLNNTFWGYRSGLSITTGSLNTGIGADALSSVTFAIGNTGIGFQALYNNNGAANTATGARALFSNTTGAYNVANGADALYSNTSGTFNVAVGFSALTKNITGSGNTAGGHEALMQNTTGSFNTAHGLQALFLNNTGYANVATGYHALNRNINGSENVANGSRAMFSNFSGNNNVAVGTNALAANTAGNQNIAIGSYALGANTTGSGNTVTGYHAMFSNTSGSNITAYGYEALRANTTGDLNTAVGHQAMLANTEGRANTAIGWGTLSSNTTGGLNIAIGHFALRRNINGAGNTACGVEALIANTGSANTAIGRTSLWNNTSGNNNTATGQDALASNTTGGFNTATGVLGLFRNVSGNFNTTLGYAADVSTPALTNATAIGANAMVNASNKVRIGNAAVTVIEGQVPFTFPSDGRFKFNVQDDVKGLDFILQLRPVTYQFDTRRFDAQFASTGTGNEDGYSKATSIRRSGFIAQEVEQAAKKSGYNFSGIIAPDKEQQHYSLSYDAFVVPMVKAMQEQQQMIDDLKKEVAELKKLIQQKNH